MSPKSARPSAARLALCVMAATLTAAPALADGMRCGTKLISDGDPMYQVRSICGAPDMQAHRLETRTVRQWVSTPCLPHQAGRCGYFTEITIQVNVDEWTYDFGPHQFVRTLYFEEQKLARITSGGYGIKIE